MNYAMIIEDLMMFYTEGEFSSEAVRAKNEFYDLAGIFDEQSSGFDMKMLQFTDWYLFTRKLTTSHTAPIQHYVDNFSTRIAAEDEQLYKNLCNNRLSLFEFIKIKGRDLYVRDLFSKYKLVIKDSPVTFGFTTEEYFQARLIPNEDSFMFSPAFCFHPPESTRFIQSEVKRVNKLPDEEMSIAREALMLRLFRMRNKFDQYRHVGIKEIYSNDSRLRV